MNRIKKLCTGVSAAVVIGSLGLAGWAGAQATLGCAGVKNATGMFVNEVRSKICADGSGGGSIRLTADSSSNTYTVRANLAKVVPAGQNARSFILPQSGVLTCDTIDTNPSSGVQAQNTCILADTNPAISLTVRVGDNSGD